MTDCREVRDEGRGGIGEMDGEMVGDGGRWMGMEGDVRVMEEERGDGVVAKVHTFGPV